MNLDKQIVKQIYELINEYENIMIFRHDSPDFDALGSQWGMYFYLKENFKYKNIYAPGYSNVVLAEGLYPNNDVLDDELFNEKFLAIVCDTGNTKRISDDRFIKADKIIKIDHHPNVEPYGDVNLVIDNISSCSELIYHLINSNEFINHKMNDKCAKYLYSGIVGDSGRFQFPPTNSDTFKACADIVSYDFNMFDEVYDPMYCKDLNNIKCMQYVLNNYKISPNGVAYYYFDSKTLKELNLDPDEGKTYLSMFSGYKEIKVWVCLVEDERANNWRGSVRSRHVIINKVCALYHGGGHSVASGCRMENFEECLKLIDDLDKEIISQGE